jgi:hypothetical protein
MESHSLEDTFLGQVLKREAPISYKIVTLLFSGLRCTFWSL